MRTGASGSRGGFTLVELMVVAAIIGLVTYVVSLSFEAIVPRERLNTSVRNLTATLRSARSEAISRNMTYQVEYDLAGRRYRMLMPFSTLGTVFREGYDDEDHRSVGNWIELPDGIDISELSIAGERYSGDQPYRVRFDARGSATEHTVVLSQPQYKAHFTVEVLALTGHFRLHETIWRREFVEEEDFR